MMLRRMTRVFIGLGLMLAVGVSLYLNDAPAQAKPQPPLDDQPVAVAAPPAQVFVTVDLCAAEATVTMPDGTVVPIWGYGLFTGAGCQVQLPGPVIRVSEGDTLTVNLINFLDVPTSMIFLGQDVGFTGGDPGLFAREAAGGGGTVSYVIPNAATGTYLYESGTFDQPQVAMGLYGALIVDPFAFPGGGQAYGDASTAYDAEEVIVLSEIDPALNAAVSAGGTFDLYDYAPSYWLMNGRAYPDTLDPDAAGTTQPFSSAIAAAPGNAVLVRYLNAGGIHHTISSLNLDQRVIGRDGDELTVGVQQYEVVAETVPSGQTTDVIIDVANAGQFPLFSRQLHITNGTAASPAHFVPGGGMMTFIQAAGP